MKTQNREKLRVGASLETSNVGRVIIMTAIFVTLASIALVCTPQIALSWIIIGAAGSCALWQVWKQGSNWWHGRTLKLAKRERLIRVLASIMGLFLATGAALYLWAFYCENADTSEEAKQLDKFLFVNAEYLLRSIVCSLDLFMLDIDSNVLDGIKSHDYLKGMISVQAILSFSCTIAVLISLAYDRVRAYVKLHRKTHIDNLHNHLYVFFGLNKTVKLLAQSIHKQELERGIIVVVEQSPVNDDDRGGWDSIVKMFTHKEQTFSDANEFDARMMFTETRLCDLEKDNLTGADVLTEINLVFLRTMIQQLSNVIDDAQLHMFFLADNEDENIRSMDILAHDETVLSVAKFAHLYCHARRSDMNQAIVDSTIVNRGLQVHIIDSSHLAVELLKTKGEYHPIRLVEIDRENPTTVKSDFCSLIVGFGESGQDALRFLYEFGAFVDSTATPEHERRSPFHCVAIDSDMDRLQGSFLISAPAAMSHRNKDGSPLIELKTCDYHSEDFWEAILQPLGLYLNCVFIAVGDDEKSMSLTVRIFNYVRQQREDLSRFRIFVRSYQSEKADLMKAIAQHYNEGYNQDSTCPSPTTPEIIVPFGMKRDIWTYDMIVGQKLTKEGMRFLEGYERQKNSSSPSSEDGLRVSVSAGEQLWNERRVKLLHSSLNDIRSLQRKEWQDIANALHAKTKLYLLQQAQANDFHKTILNLARLEHLRWNTSHEMLGYRPADSNTHCCDERTQQHNCLCPWEQLDEESRIVSEKEGWKADYKAFDFRVVDTTISLSTPQASK